MKKDKRAPDARSAQRGSEYGPQESRERFERAVDIAVATKPNHKAAKPKRQRAR